MLTPELLDRKVKLISASQRQAIERQKSRAKKNRQKGALKFWSNANKKAAALAKIHTPAANAKRSEAIRLKYLSDPDPFHQHLSEAVEARSIQRKDRLAAQIGPDYEARLRQLLLEENLTYRQIAEMFGLGRSALIYAADQAGIKKGNRHGIRYNLRRQTAEIRVLRDRLGGFSFLTGRQQRTVDFLYPDTGVPRKTVELAQILGKTRQSVQSVAQRARQRIFQEAGRRLL